jgi:hypothetical protein
MKRLTTIILAGITLLASSCNLAPGHSSRLKAAAIKAGNHVSYWYVASAVEEYLARNPEHVSLLLEVSVMLRQAETMTIEDAKELTEELLVRARVPSQASDLIHSAIFDQVETRGLKLESQVATYLATVGTYVEIGAIMAIPSSE